MCASKSDAHPHSGWFISRHAARAGQGHDPEKGEDPLAGGLLVFRDYNEGTPCHIIAEPWCSTNITMVEHRGIDESRRFADSKPSASIPRADASLRSDQNSPLDCFALSGSDPLKHHQEK